ncbi:PIG-L family deacetylase [Actinoplanes sp. NBRC 101535]|uniref:PIG-L family deacetylase n=1 Tax=Actinoplanes sp. NBRC 101535 TaxID=3032196 RepID=UPI0024A3FEE4|nr:PIG-L family deacetylase [Actinoplanes sp. NBRC 101535]GLY01976.1 hypothetical protein Acsp01_23550 [Actinoplanes sp. NBRC 101535]
MRNWIRSRFTPAEDVDGWRPGTAMSIVAHPDDDLYFLDPAISAAVTAGAPVTGIVLTAAESDGRNVDVNDPDRESAPADHAGYATARHVGLRRAYARMAGLPVDSPWEQQAVTLRTGLTVERDRLAARPEIVLYFVNLAHADGFSRYTVPPMADGEPVVSPVLSPLDLPLPDQDVDRETLIGSLVELIDEHRPTVIRTLDPDPEHDWGQPGRVVSDHVEHAATARLTIEAVHRIGCRRPVPPVVEYHRAYANRFWPTNLSPRMTTAKAGLLATYAGADGAPDPGLPYGHGDYQLGPDPCRSTHMFSTAARYAATTTWLTRLPGGRLAAFVVLGDRLAMWTERRPGSGTWRGPALIGEPGLLPTLAVAAAPDRPVSVVALRRTDRDGVVDVEVGFLTVDGRGRASAWTSLGGPDAGDPDHRRETGVPAATVDGSGDLWVFVRDFSGGLSHRRQSGGVWQDWTPLGRGPLQDVPVATTDADGTVRVFVAAKTTVATWRQTVVGGPLEPLALRTGQVASGGLTAVRTAGDRPCLLYRQGSPARGPESRDETSVIRAYRAHDTGNGWPGGRGADFGGPDGIGPVAALDRTDAGAGDLVMAQRNRFWTVSVAVPPAKEGRSRWRRLPGMISGAPALAVDAAGRGVLAVYGLDGRLHLSRQDGDLPTDAFGPWTTV